MIGPAMDSGSWRDRRWICKHTPLTTALIRELVCLFSLKAILELTF